MRSLCLGEALVDLICEHPVSGIAEADSFRPYFGGAAANVCVAAARHGAEIALVGGVGDDAWGLWLQERLKQEGVDLRWFSTVSGAQTAVAFVTVDAAGEPEFAIYGDGIRFAIESAAARLRDAIATCDAFSFASNTLIRASERRITLDGRAYALALGKPVVFDPNLRLHRWSNPAEAVTVSRECIPGLFLLKCNAAEAKLLAAESDVERAASKLLDAGARHVAITLGSEGAILRGRPSADVEGSRAHVLNATGAGDTFLGVLLAYLSRRDYDANAFLDAFPEAVEQAARATERWGAV